MTVKAILCDIEGTASSIAFVKRTLFPYARERMEGFVRERAGDAAVAGLLAETRELAGQPDLDAAATAALLRTWIDADRKAPPLKSLQGMIWEEGYRTGAFTGDIYADAAAALRRWHGAGLRLYVYSSGSVEAQRLIFGHTPFGDLTPLFSGFFDTRIGSKNESLSFRAIAEQVGLAADAILFLSDSAAELDAAADAGLRTTALDRGEVALPQGLRHPAVPDFDAVEAIWKHALPRPSGAAEAGLSEYKALDVANLAERLARIPAVAARVGSEPDKWRVREVGDGNLNLVFIVEGPGGSVVAKQALPYVRMVGESWPLPLRRSFFEYHALVRQERRAGERAVPKVFHFDERQALIVMEYLQPHVILRRALIEGRVLPLIGRDLGLFCARTAFRGSDLHMLTRERKADGALFADNVELCGITEELVFTEPYFEAELNRHTSPQLDAAARALRADRDLKVEAQRLKHLFAAKAETLCHGDLHTGSVMVTKGDTRVIDPEFAFYGPIAFDIGMLIANFWMSFFSQRGHEGPDSRDGMRDWLLGVTEEIWCVFREEFSRLWRTERTGMFYARSLFEESGDAPGSEQALQSVLAEIWGDLLGFAGIETHRRILGLAHNADFETIGDPDRRAACERPALEFGRQIAVGRHRIHSMREANELAVLTERHFAA